MRPDFKSICKLQALHSENRFPKKQPATSTQVIGENFFYCSRQRYFRSSMIPLQGHLPEIVFADQRP